jgi:hypothetical protein
MQPKEAKLTKKMTEGAKGARTYEALCDIAQDLDDAGKPDAADRLIACAEELTEESLVRLYDIIEKAVKAGERAC